MTAKRYSTPDVSCGHCRDSIREALGAVAGVTGVDVDLEAKVTSVDGDPDADEVLRVLEEVGYPATPLG